MQHYTTQVHVLFLASNYFDSRMFLYRMTGTEVTSSPKELFVYLMYGALRSHLCFERGLINNVGV